MDLPGGNGSIRRAVVLVGAGFTSPHLCERLLRGSPVACVDDLPTADVRGVGHLTDVSRFELVEAGDTSGAQAVTPLFGAPAHAARRTA